MKKMTWVVSALLAAGVCLADEAPKRVQDVTHGVVCSLPNDPNGYFGWPSIATQSDGTICVVASGLRQGHVCPWGRTTICKSKDYGKTWSYPLVINNTPMDDRDAGIVSLGGKRLAVTWFTSNTRYLFRGNRNEDGTWKNPALGRVLDMWTAEDIAKYSASWIRVSEDGEYWGDMRKAPINSPHGFIVLKDKSWLYFGKEWKFFGEGLDMYIREDTPICAARSTDEGRTWEMLGAVPLHEGVNNSQCHEAHVVELPNGELLGAIRVEGPFRVCLSRSSDGGKTWSTLEETGCIGSPPHLLRHSSGAIVCVYGYRSAGFGQRCMISYDDGKTWDKNIIIRDDGPHGDLGYPASVELPDGSIMTIYYQWLPNQNKASILWSRWKIPGVADKPFYTETLDENDAEINRRYVFKDCDCRVFVSPNYDPQSGKIALTFSGRGNTPAHANVDDPNAAAFRKKLLAEGVMIVIPFCGGDSWGSPQATSTAIKCLERLRDEAGFAIPPRFPVFGFSMGGHAALMFAVRHPDRVTKVADFFGSVDLADLAKRNAGYGQNIHALYPNEEALKEANPINHAKELAKFPVRIYHGDKDKIIPLDYSARLEKALKENGGDVKLTIVPGIGHENAILKAAGDDLIEFLK